jgi:integrase
MIQAVRRYAARHPRAKRFAHRDEAIILLTWRHELRISEALDLKWQSINLTTGHVTVLRRKGSINGRHPMERDEVHLLKKLRAEYPKHRYVFNNHHDGPMGYSAMRRVIVRAAELARLPFRISPHVLRHSCGYALANRGVDTRTIQDWMGHANIQNTVGYTRLDASRFEGLWR